jgi:flagellar basal-body rod modification protein FlgD
MNPTNPITSTTGVASTPASLYGSLPTQNGPGSLLTGNSFMQLLVSELQNQDPTSPMSASDFISQMTSMSLMTSMEQLAQYMTTLGQVSEAGAAVSLLGDNVTATTANGVVSGTVQEVVQETGAASPTLVVGGSGGTTDVPLSSVIQVTRPTTGSTVP